MAVTTSAELQTAVQDWLARSDIAGVAVDFITFGQGYLNLRLRCRQMVATDTLSPTSGVFTLPSDFLMMRSVVEDASQRRPIDPIPLGMAESVFPDRPGGLGLYYTISGTSLRVYPTISNDIIITYYQKLPMVPSTEGSSDWLLLQYPHIYMMAAKAHAYDYTHNPRFSDEFARLDFEIDQLNAQDDTAEYANAGAHSSELTP